MGAKMNHSKSIIHAVKILCDELERTYSDIRKIKYDDSMDYDTSHFESRMLVALHLEFIKAGIIT